MESIQASLNRMGNSLLCPTAFIIKGDTVLFGYRNYPPEKWKPCWTIPGGRCDAGESVEQALLREIAEEVGISDITFDAYLGDIPGARPGDIVPIFICSTRSEPQLMEPDKFREWKWFKISDFIKGEPTDFINETGRKTVAKYVNERP
jgi:8-oxo-dGTP pyrophosphatase MutT (NUDIX family)